MGTLRLKRGTKTALKTTPGFTPAEGELVYTTDSKEVFVGDGITQGGIAVSVSTQNLEDLGNVQALAAQKDQILVYNGSNWAATNNPQLDLRGNIYADDSTLLVDAINGKIVGPVETTSVTATNFVGNLTGDTVGSHTGSVVGNVVGNLTGNVTGEITGNVVGSVTGDITGSVYNADSSLVFDATSSTVFADLVGTVSADNSSLLVDGVRGLLVGDLENDSILSKNIQIRKENSHTQEDYYRDGSSSIADTASLHRILIGFNESGTPQVGDSVRWSHEYSKNYWVLSARPDGNVQYTKFLKLYKDGKVQIGGEAGGSGFDGITRVPAAELEVVGNAKVSQELLLGNMDQTAINALTASNGMMVYNTTTNKFQGYENGAWANLI